MARYTDANCRLCRREGQKLFLKGERCYSTKCAMEKRNYAPGQHGQSRKKLSEYGTQLREKQKAKRFYGLQETQFRNLFEKAAKKKGITGENMLILLETRLDNVVFRLGLASSRKEARQLINHGHFLVNGKKVNIPSYLVKKEDVIQLRDKSKTVQVINDALGAVVRRGVPQWMSLDKDSLKGVISGMPAREDITIPIQEQLIVELYSK